MQDQACERSGGRVFFASSRDPGHPPENAIDGRDGTYWISTGLYPQEIILQVSRPTIVASVKLTTTRVRAVTVEVSSEERPLNFRTLAEEELEDTGVDRLQVREMACPSAESAQPVEWVKLTIASGWSDFCSVHKLQVHGEVTAVSRQSTKGGLIQRRATQTNVEIGPAKEFLSQVSGYTELEVQIPLKQDDLLGTGLEPLAPRKQDSVHTWD
mmetsp:Transcript_51984/g.137318  ORF Transcript_51984/g.137318 Transcript_51984/m.137318 type:complete len:213 (+) Transcript_51984:120-758(+)